MEITIKIQAPELSHALETLAIALGGSMDKMNIRLEGTTKREPYSNKVCVNQATTETEIKEDNTDNIEKTEQSEEPQFTLEEVRKALGDLSKAKGKELAKGVLAQFNVIKVTDLDDSQYNAAMQAIKEA